MNEQHLVKMHFLSHPDRLCLIRVVVKRAAESMGCSEKLAEKMVLAVNEACMNIIQHAYKGDYSREIVLEILNNDNHIKFRITDHAEPVDLSCVKPRDLDDLRPGGLGTHFMQEIMDECAMGHLEGGRGNYIEMIKNINK
ncbi:MAG TPA: ATP-binding protein [Gammaproteobacteria bacterium]|nr:ATP-binding protein [Gammaproteobacteria bacterium]